MFVWAAVYCLAVNVLTLAIMAYDKKQARRMGRRTPEKWLFALSAAGGAIGTWLGMRMYRHKTKHASFVYGIPVILAVQAVLVYYMFIGK